MSPSSRKTQPNKTRAKGGSQSSALLDPPQIKKFIRRYFRAQPERGDALWSLILGNDRLLDAWRAFAKAGQKKQFWQHTWQTGAVLSRSEAEAFWEIHRNPHHLMRLCHYSLLLSLACDLFAAISDSTGEKLTQIFHFEDALLSRAAEKMGELMDAGCPAAEFWPPDSRWIHHVWDDAAVKLAGTRDPIAVAQWIADANPLVAERCLGESGYFNRSAMAPAPPELGEIALAALAGLIRRRMSFSYSHSPLPGLASLIAGSVYRGTLTHERVLKKCIPEVFHQAVYEWEGIVGTGLLENLLSTIDSLQGYAGQIENLSPDQRTAPLVLLIDDEPAMLELARLILSRTFGERLHVVSIIGGAGAFILTSMLLPDLVLTDVMEPWISGFQFVELLKKNPATQNVPFVFVSATAFRSDMVKTGMDLGAKAYLAKPFGPKDLVSLIQNVMGIEGHWSR